jgi:hypothetical protein
MKLKFFALATILGVALFAVAAHGQWNERTTVPVPAPRAYLCIEGHSASEITRKATEAGARGWKMVAATSAGSRGIWCFEQLAAARPLEN